MYDTLFIVLWNGTENGQRVLWLDPRRVGQEGYVPGVFMTGLIRPTDVIVDTDGSLLVADYIYGHVWRVRYGTAAKSSGINPIAATAVPTEGSEPTAAAPMGFMTNTPNP